MKFKKFSIFNNESNEFLSDYLSAVSPSGYEKDGQEIWAHYTQKYAHKQIVDAYGSCISILNPDHPFKVVIEAHADEIAWAIQYIDEKGWIYIARNGGSDEHISSARFVHIYTQDQQVIEGVISWPPIHFRTSNAGKMPHKIEDLIVDVGVTSKKEVEELGISVGDTVFIDTGHRNMRDHFLLGRGLDDKIGGFIIAEVLKRIHTMRIDLPFGLYVVNAVQEEVGTFGAQMVVENIKPNIALVHDVTFDTQLPLINKKMYGDCFLDKGPVIFQGAEQHGILKKLTIETAKANKIPVQILGNLGAGGTDASPFAHGAGGVATLLCGIPLRNMHSPVEMVSVHDVQHMIELYVQLLSKISPQINLSYLGWSSR